MNSNNVEQANANLNEEFEVALYENVTTGYSWQIQLSSGLQLMETYTITTPNPPVGQGGTRIWVLQATQPGTQYFKGIYKRAWEPTTGNEKSYQLNVYVNSYQTI